MRATVTSRLVDKLNKARGLTYPSIGYLRFTDIKGDGISKPALFEIIHAGGGLRRSELNGPPRQRCAKLRAALKASGKPPARRSHRIAPWDRGQTACGITLSLGKPGLADLRHATCEKCGDAIQEHRRTGRVATYRGIGIDRVEHNGMWVALLGGRYLKADTLAGIRTLIRENL